MTPGDGKARAILHAGGPQLAAALDELLAAEALEREAARAWRDRRAVTGRRRRDALEAAIAAGIDNRVVGARFPDVLEAHRAAPPAGAMVPPVG